MIDAHFLHPEGVAAWLLARAFRVPFVVTMRGNELQYAQRPFHRSSMRRAVRRAARVFPVSQQLGDLAVSLGADRARVRPIGNGVDASTYQTWESPPPRNGRGAVILTAGRLIALKGFHHILRALETLLKKGLDAELHIAGETGRGLESYAGELRSLAASLGLSGRLQLLGWIPQQELARHMSRADVFCLASSREGSPNVVLEALACGAPVVATDVGDVRRMIGDSRHGLCVPPGDDAALAAALEQALSADWDRPALSAYAHQRTWPQVAREIYTELEAALEDPRSQNHSATEPGT